MRGLAEGFHHRSPWAELRNAALTSRADVRVARSNLNAADYALKLAEAQRRRDVVVGVEYQRVGSDHAVGVTSQIPLFVYNNQTAAIAQAKAQRDAAEAQLRQVERQAGTDVQKAHESYLVARRALALYDGATLKQIAEVREIVAYSYNRGSATLLELLDAERQVRQISTAYNQARANVQLGIFSLEQAVGKPIH